MRYVGAGDVTEAGHQSIRLVSGAASPAVRQAAIDSQLLASDEARRVRAQKGHGIGQGVAIERLRNALHALDHGLVILRQATGLQAVHHHPRQHGIDRDVVRFRLFLLQREFAHDFDT